MITKFNFKDRTIKSYAIRKLTPFECYRLMGVRDATIHIMQQTVADIKKKGLQLLGFNYDTKSDIVLDVDKNEDGTPSDFLLKRLKKKGGKFLRFTKSLLSDDVSYFMGCKIEVDGKMQFKWVSALEYRRWHEQEPEKVPISPGEIPFPAQAEYAGLFTSRSDGKEWKEKVMAKFDQLPDCIYVEVRFYTEYIENQVHLPTGQGTHTLVEG